VAKIEDENLFESHKGESETIAGFVLEIAQGFPKRGSEISFHNYLFTVESLDKKRLRQIKISLPKEK
jgi:CBS domain containing-hemolysin-like protein